MAKWSKCIRTWFNDNTCHQYHLAPKTAEGFQFITYFPYHLLLLKHNFLNLKELDCERTVLMQKKKSYASVTSLVSCNKNSKYRPDRNKNTHYRRHYLANTQDSMLCTNSSFLVLLHLPYNNYQAHK